MRAGVLLLLGVLIGLGGAVAYLAFRKDEPRAGEGTGGSTYATETSGPNVPVYRVLAPDASWGVIEGTVRLARHIGVPTLRRKPGGCENDVSWTERASEILAYAPETGMLTDCLVFLRKVEAGKDWPAAQKTDPRLVTLTLRDGLLTPRLSWVRTGAQLKLASEMPRTQANLRGHLGSLVSGQAATFRFNVLLTPNAAVLPSDDTQLRHPGVTTVTSAGPCLRWLLAHVLTFDHPYVAGPTLLDGVYQLEGVPPGDYTVVCWHGPLTLVTHIGEDGEPLYGYGPSVQTTQPVKVEPGQRMRVDFVLDGPR